MTTFQVGTVSAIPFYTIGLSLLVIAIVLFVAVLIMVVRKTGSDQMGDMTSKSGSPLTQRAFILLIAFILLFPGVTFIMVHPNPSTITVGAGYIAIKGNAFGSQNYTSSDIETAFVGNTVTGNITLARRDNGLASGYIDEGRFTLSNGATAYVITANATHAALFVKTTSSVWLVLGTNNTNSLVSVFSSDVMQVQG